MIASLLFAGCDRWSGNDCCIRDIYSFQKPPLQRLLFSQSVSASQSWAIARVAPISVHLRVEPPHPRATIKAHPTAPILPRPYGQEDDSSLSERLWGRPYISL